MHFYTDTAARTSCLSDSQSQHGHTNLTKVTVTTQSHKKKHIYRYIYYSDKQTELPWLWARGRKKKHHVCLFNNAGPIFIWIQLFDIREMGHHDCVMHYLQGWTRGGVLWLFKHPRPGERGGEKERGGGREWMIEQINQLYEGSDLESRERENNIAKSLTGTNPPTESLFRYFRVRNLRRSKHTEG